MSSSSSTTWTTQKKVQVLYSSDYYKLYLVLVFNPYPTLARIKKVVENFELFTYREWYLFNYWLRLIIHQATAVPLKAGSPSWWRNKKNSTPQLLTQLKLSRYGFMSSCSISFHTLQKSFSPFYQRQIIKQTTLLCSVTFKS